MDKIISSILCCSFGSKLEQKLSSTTSSRDSLDINKITNKVDKSDETEEAEYYHNNEEIAKKSHNNNIENQEMLNSSNNNNKNKRNIIHQQPAAKSSIVLQDSSENLKSNKDSNEIHNDVQIQSEKITQNYPQQQQQQHPVSFASPTTPSQQTLQQHQQNVENSDEVSLEYPEEPEFDLTAMQPGQKYSPSGWLLEKKSEKFSNKKCLILDLDETLVHSSFKYLRSADFVIPVEIEGQVHNVYVIKRPGVDEFMKRVGEIYEVVVFTASVSRYGDPLLDELDIHKSIHHRLFRDSCYNFQGNYIKNLSQIGRPLSDLIIIDNSPASYIFHPQHAVPILSWFSDAHDNELLDLLPFLEDLAQDDVDDISLVLDVTV